MCASSSRRSDLGSLLAAVGEKHLQHWVTTLTVTRRRVFFTLFYHFYGVFLALGGSHVAPPALLGAEFYHRSRLSV